MREACIDHGTKGDKRGYGKTKRGGKTLFWHRIVYCESAGVSLASINGLVVRHECDNPRCINPAHLKLGSQGANMADCSVRRRHARSVLSQDAVRDIRSNCVPSPRGKPKSENQFSYSAFARKYGVHAGAVRDVVAGRSYKHDSRAT